MENFVKFDAFYLVKLIFGECFSYFDANCVADLLNLHLQLDAIRVPVRERVNIHFTVCKSTSSSCLHFLSDVPLKTRILKPPTFAEWSFHVKKCKGVVEGQGIGDVLKIRP